GSSCGSRPPRRRSCGSHRTAIRVTSRTRTLAQTGEPRMHYAIVSETYPPEVNGVALTVQALEQGLRARGHDVDVIRPRQPGATAATAGELLVRGVRLPRYPGLQFGLPAT